MAVMEACLPVDIINEILLRLPVKSLLRFRCVSKEWLSLISDSQFTTLHLSRSKKRKKHSLFTITDDDPSFFCTLIGEDHNSRFQVNYPCQDHSSINLFFGLSSCDGLLCYSILESCREARSPLYLMNPATREIKSLPHFSNPFYRQVESLTYNWVGLGFEPISRDYKVVKIVYYPDSTRNYPQANIRKNVSVYSLNSCNWRILEDIPAPEINTLIRRFVPRPVIVFNGVAYWMLFSGKAYSFDLVHAVSRELPSLPGESFYRDLFLMGDSQLSVLCYTCGPQQSSSRVELWVMKESGVQKSWIKHRIIYFYNWNHDVVQRHWDYKLVGGQWNDDDDGILFFHVSRKLVLYSTKNNSQRDLGIHGLPTTRFKVMSLTESLVKLVE